MTDDTRQPLPHFQIRHFQSNDRSQFLALAAATDIKAHFDEFNLDQEIIAYKFGHLNDDIPYTQYWGIFLPDDDLAGFIGLKKSPVIYGALQKQAAPPKTDKELVFETLEQETHGKWREKIKAPYSADVAIHPDHRRKRLAQAALNWLYCYTAAAGLREFYLEVREDNTASGQLIRCLDPELVVEAAIHFGHDLYRVEINIPARSSTSLLEDIRTADSGEKETYTVLRHCLMAFPVLSAYRDLLLELFRAMKSLKAELVTTDQCRGCSHEIDELTRRVIVCLRERPDPLTLVWSLAHELGHLLQDEPQGNERREFTLQKFRREEDAWKQAERWLDNKPLFLFQWEHFYKFRHERLESYFPSEA